jgi:CRISPR/Cas system-associated endonuclease/helicase Cas3
VVSAPTGAGKSLVYQLYFLDRLARAKSARMIALFPTHTLVFNQVQKFNQLASNGVPPGFGSSATDPLLVRSLKIPSLNRLIEYSVSLAPTSKAKGGILPRF